MSKSDGQLVSEHALTRLGKPETWDDTSDYGYKSLALCIIDSVFSLRTKYGVVENVIKNYRSARESDGSGAESDGTTELLVAIQKHDGSALFKNEQYAPGTKVKKYTAVKEAAESLQSVGINSRDDFVERLKSNSQTGRVRDAWLGTTGLGVASWHYLQMLTGEQDSKPDIWIKRFVAAAIGLDLKQLSDERARLAIIEAADLLDVAAVKLDHNIWRAKGKQRSRS